MATPGDMIGYSGDDPGDPYVVARLRHLAEPLPVGGSPDRRPA